MSLYTSYWRYLGKANQKKGQKTEYHLLAYHCLDVAAVGAELLRQDSSAMLKDLSELLDIPADQLEPLLIFLLALHDLGKFSAAFQHLAVFEDFKHGLQPPEYGYKADTYRHDRLGIHLVDRLFGQSLLNIPEWQTDSRTIRTSTKTLKQLFDVVLGHHGKPIGDQTTEMSRYFCEENTADAVAFVDAIYQLLNVQIPMAKLVDRDWKNRFRIASWLLAGWAVLADWLGSDREYFPYCSIPAGTGPDLNDYWRRAQQKARVAVRETDLATSVKAAEFTGFRSQFGFEPTPLQAWAESVPISLQPQLFILEDITGSGKTEAALTLAQRLMSEAGASGFYFGLPTMATSTAMFDRVGKHYRTMFKAHGRMPSLVLAHSAREMDEGFREAIGTSEKADRAYDAQDDSASIFCNQWLADSRKKALLAPVGVGTIDQVLLGVLPRKHQSLRLLGLYGKVLLLDEIHSADEYMLTLLEQLLKLHLHQGGSAILLTATLSFEARERLCQIWQANTLMPPRRMSLKPSEQWLTQKRALNDFPLATHATIGQPLQEQTLGSRKEVSREVLVNFKHVFDDVVDQAAAAAQAGHCVVWVRNSVGDAQKAYNAIQERMATPENCLLFHSRFTLNDRKRIEAQVLKWIGKHSTRVIRAGKIICSTQVFQESLDADADILITDLCPIDDLIQRAGRLHRHSGPQRGQRGQPVLTVFSPEWSDNPPVDWLRKDFSDAQTVYVSPALLWRSMKVLRDKGAYRMPDDARLLIESVYGTLRPEVPEALYELELALNDKKKLKHSDANTKSIDWTLGYSQAGSTLWSDSEADIGTRYIEQKTETLMLVKRVGGYLEPWVNDGRFAVELSSVKLAENKVKKLTAVLEANDPVVMDFLKRYPKASYLKLWLPKSDSVMHYSSETGVTLG